MLQQFDLVTITTTDKETIYGYLVDADSDVVTVSWLSSNRAIAVDTIRSITVDVAGQKPLPLPALPDTIPSFIDQAFNAGYGVVQSIRSHKVMLVETGYHNRSQHARLTEIQAIANHAIENATISQAKHNDGTIPCLAKGTVLDNLYIVQDTDVNNTVICYVSTPYGRDVRKILAAKTSVLGFWIVSRVRVRKVKDYRMIDQLKGIAVYRL